MPGEGRVFVICGSGTPLSGPYDIDAVANASFIGETGGAEQAGCSIAYAGDVNNDSYGDILIGADGYNSNQGKVYVVYGNGSLTKNMNLALANASFIGENTGDYAGVSVASAGDVNGDGYADIAVGAYEWTGSGFNQGKGRAYLIYGNGSLNKNMGLGAANASYTGEGMNGSAGCSVAGGDFNGDGRGDILIGAPTYSNNGKTYLVYGPLDISKDTYPPTYGNLTYTNPLELGNTEIISIDVTDPAGSVMVNQTLIQFGGTNHSIDLYCQ